MFGESIRSKKGTQAVLQFSHYLLVAKTTWSQSSILCWQAKRRIRGHRLYHLRRVSHHSSCPYRFQPHTLVVSIPQQHRPLLVLTNRLYQIIRLENPLLPHLMSHIGLLGLHLVLRDPYRRGHLPSVMRNDCHL